MSAVRAVVSLGERLACTVTGSFRGFRFEIVIKEESNGSD